ncbi:hypothetical protein FDQ22_14035 [Listeria monocytogenes]|nr:hypothetical protein [Listeria monocytogenes]EIL7052224.1 EndoU domain-containing protein [Listeria monocytogenes]EIM6131164.1 EndoU domain-containing protein [Listeria monocytogenes]
MADIKLNYGVLEDIGSELYRYMRALEEMKSALEQISQIIGSQTGQAIEAVQARKELLTEHTSTYKIMVNEVYILINNYINEMKSYIKPLGNYANVRVDRDDIWFNLTNLDASKTLPEMGRTVHLPTETIFTSEEDRIAIRTNWAIVEEIHAGVSSFQARLDDKLYEMEQLFNQKVVRFDECDHYFKAKAVELHNKYTDSDESRNDFYQTCWDNGGKYWNGFTEGSLNLFLGMSNGIGDFFNYGAAHFAVAVFPVVGWTPPDWTVQTVIDGDKVLAALVKDPSLILEGTGQGIVDTVQDKNYGPFYVAGFATAFAVQYYAIKLVAEQAKPAGQLRKIAKNYRVEMRPDAFEHIFKGEGISRQGVVSGAHNIEEFYRVLTEAGYSLDDCIISQKPHPYLEGITEITYRIKRHKLTPSGILTDPPEYRISRAYSKTVFDPAVYSNEQIYEWGLEAMKNVIEVNEGGGYVIGEASNGLKFKAFFVEDSGVINNFFPILE